MIAQKSELEESLRLARDCITGGYLDSALEWLDTTYFRSVNAGVEIPYAQITAILESARSNGLDVEAGYRRLAEKELRRAEGNARFGFLDNVIGNINRARKYGAGAGVELPEEKIKLLFGTTYKNRIGAQVRNAGHGVNISATTLAGVEELAYQEGVRAADDYIKGLPK